MEGLMNQTEEISPKKTVTPINPNEVWWCREYWVGDSSDGQFLNGDGYHYFKMQGNGKVLSAVEYYETDDGLEKSNILHNLVGINWFEYFGFEDDELLEKVAAHEFEFIKQLAEQNN